MSNPRTKVYSQGKFEDAGHPTVTQSFLNLFAACPFAAFKRYVEGEITPPGIAALQGTSVDEAVTFGADSVINTGQDASLEDKKEIAANTFEKRKDDHYVAFDENLYKLKDQTIRMVEAHHNEIAPTLRPIATQLAIKIAEPEYDLACTIDLVDEGHVLRDTKTAKKRNQYPEKGFIQKELYSRLYKEHTGFSPKKFIFDVLVKVVRPGVERVETTPVENTVLDHVIHSTLSEYFNSLRSGVWRIAENGHWRCASSGKWCGYLYTGCPKGKKL